MRKYFIDNLRWICVLLLIPYHTLMVFNTFESFYIKGDEIEAATRILSAIWPWFMPLLFLLAGASSAYSLEKRTVKEYIRERVFKLLIPLLFGVLLLVPVQTYFAEKFHNSYSGSYFGQYILFFTKPTDLTGYQGGFTPAHLWFIMYLFIISLIALPVQYLYQKSGKKFQAEKIPFPLLILFLFIPGFSQVILDISGKSVGEYLAYYLFGYFLISSGALQEKLEKYRFLLLGLSLPCMIFSHTAEAIGNFNLIIYEILYNFYAWGTILAIIGFGKRHLNFENRVTSYFSKSSFSVYVYHQEWIVICAYFTLKLVQNIPLQMISISITTFIFTFLTYEVFKRFPVTRFMFGIKKQ